MRAYYEKVGLILILIFFNCFYEKDQTWEMMAVGLPAKVAPEIAPINMGYYILKQTHQTIFEKDNVKKILTEIA